MPKLDIHQFPCLQDNYGVLIHDAERGVTAAIDAPSADDVRAALAATGWKLTYILTTHHHADHTAGNQALKAETGCIIIGPRDEAAKIPGIDTAVGEGEAFRLGGFQVQVIETPGHTSGHISFVIPQANVAFVGDTLFAMGCGRVLEGTMEQMWSSLAKIAKLPGDTMLYCGHEYTVSNGTFGLAMEPGNAALARRLDEVKARRAVGKPTLPTRVDVELDTNVFLRPHVAAIRKLLGMEGAEDWQVFGELRTRKNKA
jgi:hydroxyacylglutathione hydrolase